MDEFGEAAEICEDNKDNQPNKTISDIFTSEHGGSDTDGKNFFESFDPNHVPMSEISEKVVEQQNINDTTNSLSEAWLPTEITRQVLLTIGTSSPEAHHLTTPGVVVNDPQVSEVLFFNKKCYKYFFCITCVVMYVKSLNCTIFHNLSPKVNR